MKSYLLTLLVTALAVAVIGIIVPSGERSGISKHIRLVAALVWICVLIAPLSGVISDVKTWWEEIVLSVSDEDARGDYEEEWTERLDGASTAYFCEMLTQTLEERFSIARGDLTCSVIWEKDGEDLSPQKITLHLSGKAIWKSPRDMEVFVRELVGCECITVIDS